MAFLWSSSLKWYHEIRQLTLLDTKYTFKHYINSKTKIWYNKTNKTEDAGINWIRTRYLRVMSTNSSPHYQVAQLCQRDRAKLNMFSTTVQRIRKIMQKIAFLSHRMRASKAISTLSESFNAIKLCSRVSSR